MMPFDPREIHASFVWNGTWVAVLNNGNIYQCKNGYWSIVFTLYA